MTKIIRYQPRMVIPIGELPFILLYGAIPAKTTMISSLVQPYQLNGGSLQCTSSYSKTHYKTPPYGVILLRKYVSIRKDAVIKINNFYDNGTLDIYLTVP